MTEPFAYICPRCFHGSREAFRCGGPHRNGKRMEYDFVDAIPVMPKEEFDWKVKTWKENEEMDMEIIEALRKRVSELEVLASPFRQPRSHENWGTEG